MTTPLLLILAILLLIPAAVVIIVYTIKAFTFIVKRVFGFIFGMIGDLLRLIGVFITVPILSLLVVANIIIGRWSAAGHFGKGVADECRTLGAAAYRLIIGHPARLLCLTPLTEGLERRLPQIVADAPGADKPAKRTGAFGGYEVTGSLACGGSGGKLYLARPDERKRGSFLRQGIGEVDQVVIKSFHLREGSSLPQIVRESRSLDAARKMGLVLEHELTDERFFYVMRYAPGESLSRVTQQMHAMTGGKGLSKRDLRTVLGYERDLLDTLAAYHAGGLWHKDVKPDNIIVDGDRARLVDFGLITHLRSAMTLTTHGTEYFRDPEMVRMALRGVKVNEVDGERFDVYAAGAVLYSMIENSFPAHGGLSRISQPCPESIRWIVRRAMTDYDKRYRSAREMLSDLQFVLSAEDMFAITPGQLPSMGGQAAVASMMDADEVDDPRAFAQPARHAPPPPLPRAAAPDAPNAPQAPAPEPPRVRLLNWWTGSFAVGHEQKPVADVPVSVGAPAPAFIRAGAPPMPGNSGRQRAADQIAAARQRAHSRRHRAHERRRALTGRGRKSGGGARFGVGLAIILVVMPAIAAGLITVRYASSQSTTPYQDGPEFIMAPPAPPAPELTPRVETRVELAEELRRVIRHTAADRGNMDGTLLVVRDATGLSLEQRAVLEHRLAALRAAGVRVLDAQNADDEELDHVTDLLAKLRRHVGVNDPRTISGSKLVGEWVTQADGVDAIYWIAADERDASRATTITGARGNTGQTIINALRRLP
jgi:serine/threonine protein kinase